MKVSETKGTPSLIDWCIGAGKGRTSITIVFGYTLESERHAVLHPEPLPEQIRSARVEGISSLFSDVTGSRPLTVDILSEEVRLLVPAGMPRKKRSAFVDALRKRFLQ